MDKAYLYTDGGARGNPGPAAIGVVIVGSDEELITKKGEYIGFSTNNQAEYNALLEGLKLAKKHTNNEIVITSDSELVVKQLKGEYKVKSNELKPLYDQVQSLIKFFKKVSFNHVRRSNKWIRIADSLVNEALDKKEK